MKVGVKQRGKKGISPRVPAEFPTFCRCVSLSAASGSPWKSLGAAQGCGLALGTWLSHTVLLGRGEPG